MIERGEIALDTDPDYIKALVTKNLVHYAWTMYNEDWTFVRSDSAEPFLTSDNPVAMKYSGAPGEAVRRFLPLTPRLCLALKFDSVANPAAERLMPEELKKGLAQPPKGAIGYVAANEELCWHLNRYQAQAAEGLVFSSRLSDADRQLVAKCANFRLDVECVQFPDPAGDPDAMIQGSILRVREVRDSI